SHCCHWRRSVSVIEEGERPSSVATCSTVPYVMGDHVLSQISDEPATGCAGPVDVECGAVVVPVSHPLRAAVVSDERGQVPVLHQRRDGVPGAPTEDVPGVHTDGVVVVRPRRLVACDVVL